MDILDLVPAVIGSLMMIVSANAYASQFKKYNWRWFALGCITAVTPFVYVFGLHVELRLGGGWYWMALSVVAFLSAFSGPATRSVDK